ncbi:MAG: hypothetical protein AB7T38_03795 [Nitrospirales bacterium]
MKCLNQFLERVDIQNIISGCRESKTVQGVNIRLNRLWLRAWRVGERYDPFNPRKGYEKYFEDFVNHFPPRGLLHDNDFLGESLDPWIPTRPPDSKDLKCLPRHPWEWITWPPILVTIRLYPNASSRGELPRFQVPPDDFQLIYETCPLARLYAGPKVSHRPVVGGISIGVNATDFGTLGGVLKDNTGRYYGITCGHIAQLSNVVEQPSRADGGTGKTSVIGKVIHAEVPPAFPSYLPQNRKNQSNHAGRVDISVFEVSVGARQEILKLGPIKGILPVDDLEQDHRLEMTGLTSDWKVLSYGGITPYHNIHNTTTGDNYCYENPLMLRDSSGTQPVQPGDSGAWVCTPSDQGYAWAGMVVGGDGQVGFAVSAEALQQWWEDTPRSMSLALS